MGGPLRASGSRRGKRHQGARSIAAAPTLPPATRRTRSRTRRPPTCQHPQLPRNVPLPLLNDGCADRMGRRLSVLARLIVLAVGSARRWGESSCGSARAPPITASTPSTSSQRVRCAVFRGAVVFQMRKVVCGNALGKNPVPFPEGPELPSRAVTAHGPASKRQLKNGNNGRKNGRDMVKKMRETSIRVIDDRSHRWSRQHDCSRRSGRAELGPVDPWGGSGKTAQRPNAGETVDRCCQQCKLERGVASEPPACGRRRRR